jgi:integrase
VRAVLDKIVDAGAPVAANRASTALKTFFRFCVDRGDLAGSPVEGMRRPGGEERPRDRRLSDDEVRAFWWATDTTRPVAKDAKDKPHPVFAPALRAILMTAQRPGEVLGMRWHELEGDDDKAVWRIPSSRSKTHREQVVPLSKAALAHIRAQPRIGHGPVFTTNGTAPFSGDSKLKPAVDLAMRTWIESNLPADALRTLQAKHGDVLPRWTPHDLRRTARSLMSRAGIRPDIAERVLGHARPTIEETYDVHEYEAEKRDALEKLATLVAEIVANETAMKKERSGD